MPPWLAERPDIADLIDQHGRYFLALFSSNAHLDHFLATGDLRRPASVRRQARQAANPVASQRDRLRKRLDSTRRGLKDAERRVVAARKEIAASPYPSYRAEQELTEQMARVADRTAALKRDETELELFDLLHEIE
jgi:hypothetical protein